MTSHRRLDDVPWARRSQVRHIMKQLGSEADQFRTDMLHGELNADGAVEDATRMIGELHGVIRLLRQERNGEWDNTPASCLAHHREVTWIPSPGWWVHSDHQTCTPLLEAPAAVPTSKPWIYGRYGERGKPWSWRP